MMILNIVFVSMLTNLMLTNLKLKKKFLYLKIEAVFFAHADQLSDIYLITQLNIIDKHKFYTNI